MKRNPTIQYGNGVPKFMINGEPALLLSGQLHNSSSSSEEYMESIWPKLKAMNLNTVIATVSWELIEDRQGVFSFLSVDHLIESAREYGLKLVIIWFGTWKNGSSTYVPDWIKLDRERYFRCKTMEGTTTKTISPLCEVCCEKDSRAFAALMRHIREIDEEEQTVIMMQVENESGLYGSELDWSAPSLSEYYSPVPEGLIEELNKKSLNPVLAEAYTGIRKDWESAFGNMARECFMAYHFAEYMGKVAETGKKEYAIPMYANIWPSQYPGEHAALRPSGGPNVSVYEIWKYAAPALDALAPDLYEENFVGECMAYKQGGENPLLLSELRYDKWATAMILYAISQGALMVSPFGIDSISKRPGLKVPDMIQGVHQMMSSHDSTEHITKLYAELNGLQKRIVKAGDTGNLFGILQGNLVQDGLNMGPYHIRVSFAYPLESMHYPGALLIIREKENEFIMIGLGLKVEFFSCRRAQVEYLSIDEGSFAEGEWSAGRRLNGDEMQVTMSEDISVLCVRVHEF